MTDVFTIRAGNRLPFIASVLSDANGPIDLTTASAVTFSMRPLSSTTLAVDAQAAEIVDAEAGQVHYEWQEGDTDNVGFAIAEWTVTYPDTRTLTVPNAVPISISATPSLVDLPTISPSELATIRAQIGTQTPPTDVDLAILLNAMGTPHLVAAHILEGRLLGPQKIKLDGDLELDYGDRKPLAAAIARLRSSNGDGTSQGLLYRTDRER